VPKQLSEKQEMILLEIKFINTWRNTTQLLFALSCWC